MVELLTPLLSIFFQRLFSSLTLSKLLCQKYSKILPKKTLHITELATNYSKNSSHSINFVNLKTNF